MQMRLSQPLRRSLVRMASSLDMARSVVGISVMASTLTLGALYLGQRSLIFPRPSVIEEPRGGQVLRIPAGREDVGSAVVCAYYPPPDDESPVVIYWHGNADQIGWSGTWLARRLGRLGFVAVEYPGYGLSEGSPTQASIFWSALRVFDYVTNDLGVDPSRVRLLGQSIGCAPALYVGTVRPTAKLVLLSPFTSIAAVANSVFPFLPVALLEALVKDPFRNDVLAPACVSPVLVVHGTRDEIVPFVQGKAIAGLLPESKFLPLEGVGHNDLFAPPHDAALLAHLLEFLDT